MEGRNIIFVWQVRQIEPRGKITLLHFLSSPECASSTKGGGESGGAEEVERERSRRNNLWNSKAAKPIDIALKGFHLEALRVSSWFSGNGGRSSDRENVLFPQFVNQVKRRLKGVSWFEKSGLGPAKLKQASRRNLSQNSLLMTTVNKPLFHLFRALLYAKQAGCSWRWETLPDVQVSRTAKTLTIGSQLKVDPSNGVF